MAEKITIHKRKLAEYIKFICQQKGISIPNLETDAGYSPGMISRWASSNPDEDFIVLSKLATMAKILDISTDELLGIPKKTESLIQAKNPDIFSTLAIETINGSLIWNTLDVQKNQLLFGSQFPNHESGRIIAETWYATLGNVSFVLIAYCDDLADFNEPLELVLYGFVGHGIAPLLICPTTQESIHTLYAYIQFMTVSEYLSCNQINTNNTDVTHAVTDIKHNLFHNNMIDFDHIKSG